MVSSAPRNSWKTYGAYSLNCALATVLEKDDRIFDFSDKINQYGLKVIFSNAEESNILTKKAIVSMSQIHSTNIELVNDKNWKAIRNNAEKITNLINA